MFRQSILAASFALTLGLTGCAPPAEDPATLAATEELEQAKQELDAAKTAAEEAEAKAKVAEAEAAKARARERAQERAQAAPKAPPAPAVCNECGVVASVEAIKAKGAGSGAGAVLGAIAGGVIGHQFGGGSGKDVATAAGAIAGGYGGHQAEKQIRASTIYRIGVNMENGSYQTVDVADPAGLSAGSRVRVIGNNIQLR